MYTKMKRKKKLTHSLIKSFAFALAGIGTAYLRERNFRIHLACGLIAVYAGFLFNLNRTQWIALTLTIGLVLFSELVNTALEHLVDSFCKEENENARIIKDIAASAVLVSSVAALVVGALIFWQPDRFGEVWQKITDAPFISILILCASLLVVCLPKQSGKSAE